MGWDGAGRLWSRRQSTGECDGMKPVIALVRAGVVYKRQFQRRRERIEQ